ncbi:hypothetical protein DL96DRAFT_305390 [Flagelloscypha sp. PMI_526]|nr:hypothetical protein DL96DRAFT_305390 [Flagelloscypha sp. PMI_526]
MFSKATVFSAVAAVAVAQTISISGASSDCNSALNTLNSDSALTASTKSLLAAGSSFNSTTASSSATEQALSTFCSTPNPISSDAVRSALSTLYSKCGPELSAGANKEVTEIYDVVYALVPYRNALCSKNDDGKFCAASGSASSTIPTADGGSMTAQEVLQSMGTTTPNADVFTKTNALFLFLNPSTSTDTLCSGCSRSILTAYMDFETSLDYAPGLKYSPLLSGQKALYNAIESKCPSGFLEGSLQAAGSLSTGSDNAASPRQVLSGVTTFSTVLLSALALAAF